MRVGLYFHGRVPVRRYGGTQRVVTWLADALAELGHEPVLIVPRGSRSERAEVVALPRRVFGREMEPGYDLDPWLPEGLDAVHFHNGVRVRTRLPSVMTIHGNEELDDDLRERAVFVSRDHMERMGGRRFVYNGLPPGEYWYREEKGDYLLFLGKARWEVKGVDRAERIARRAGAKLVIAGGRRWNPSPRIRSVGMVGGDRKRALLAGARALLNPVRWEEPFGLVVIEALASGTPVLASPRGAMPELVTGEVGALCGTEEEFVAAVGRAGAVDPAACRARVEERFTARRMAEEYVELYRTSAAEAT